MLAQRLLRIPFWLAVSALVLACNGQGEGEVCDKNAGNSGNDDCASGLVCTPNTQLAAGTVGARCCPVDVSKATTTVCQGTIGVLDASSAPPDGGSLGAGGDATSGVQPDASQAGTGGGSDAMVEGGAAATPVDARTD
jgi:hypothetical protein